MECCPCIKLRINTAAAGVAEQPAAAARELPAKLIAALFTMQMTSSGPAFCGAEGPCWQQRLPAYERNAIWLEMKSSRVVRMTSPATNGMADSAVA